MRNEFLKCSKSVLVLVLRACLACRAEEELVCSLCCCRQMKGSPLVLGGGEGVFPQSRQCLIESTRAQVLQSFPECVGGIKIEIAYHGALGLTVRGCRWDVLVHTSQNAP